MQHSGVFRSAAFCRYLPEFGITPIVVSGQPGSFSRVPGYGDASNSLDTKSNPASQMIDWRLDRRSEDLSRVIRTMLRLPLLNTLARRHLALQTVDTVFAAGAQIIEAEQPAVILATSPPVESLLAAERLAREYRLPYVCDLRDPWTHFPWMKYRHWIDFVLERRKEREVLNRSAKVVANTPTAQRILVKHVRVQESRVVVIPNGYDEAEFSDIEAEKQYPGRFVIAYTGLLSTPNANSGLLKGRIKKVLGLDYRPLDVDFTLRSPRYVLAAAERLLEERPELRQILLLLFVGNFAETDRQEFGRFRYPECLEVKQPVSSIEALRICCGVQMLLLLQVGMRFRGQDLCPCIPGKLFNYLRTGTPILAALESKDANDLISVLTAGTVIAPRDVPGMASVISAEIDRWRHDGASQYRRRSSELEKYSRRRLTGSLAEVLWAADGRERLPPPLHSMDVAESSSKVDRCSTETIAVPD
jgi:glycosyltransferase involved in cell wall biosynthesis